MEEFIKMSKMAGMREDLVQAGGGNSSVKLEKDKMLIKASGTQLADISTEDGFAVVNPQVIVDFFNHTPMEEITKESENVVLQKAYISGKRPSIETFLHAITDVYTLHTHPMLVNVLTSRTNGMDILKTLFPKALFVGYATPGIELAKEYFITYMNEKEYEDQIFDVIFLKNHGVIVSGKNGIEVIEKTNVIINQIAEHLQIDISSNNLSTRLYTVLCEATGQDEVVYLSNDAHIESAIKTFGGAKWEFTFCPDCIVYCGKKILSLDSDFAKEDIQNFMEQYGKPVIIYMLGRIYIVAQSVKKAKEIESVLSFSAQVASNNKQFGMDLLSEQEQNFLLNWDAEKYRQNMK